MKDDTQSVSTSPSTVGLPIDSDYRAFLKPGMRVCVCDGPLGGKLVACSCSSCALGDWVCVEQFDGSWVHTDPERLHWMGDEYVPLSSPHYPHQCISRLYVAGELFFHECHEPKDHVGAHRARCGRSW